MASDKRARVEMKEGAVGKRVFQGLVLLSDELV
jgi:hypothetical protein